MYKGTITHYYSSNQSYCPVWSFDDKEKKKKNLMPRGCLRFVIVVFPDHTHLLLLMAAAKLGEFKSVENENYKVFFLSTATIFLRLRIELLQQILCLQHQPSALTAQCQIHIVP